MLVSRITSSDAMPTRSIFGRAHISCLLGQKKGRFSGRELQTQFFNDPGHSGIAVQCPENKADIYADTFVIAGNIHCIAGKRLLVSIESQTDEFATGIEDRTAGVASRDVIVGQEVNIHQ